MAKLRVERDSLGTIAVPNEHLWGAQTQRSLAHFHFSGEVMPSALVHALVLVKRAAVNVNFKIGLLDKIKADAIISAADEVLRGDYPDEFPLVVWQTGSGTQTNMNVSEVLANRASQILFDKQNRRRGGKKIACRQFIPTMM
jgi:fumarate hydratase, class II